MKETFDSRTAVQVGMTVGTRVEELEKVIFDIASLVQSIEDRLFGSYPEEGMDAKSPRGIADRIANSLDVLRAAQSRAQGVVDRL